MTVTETSTEAGAASAQPARGRWLTTADHKRIGLLWLYASLLFLLVAGVVGLVLRAELAEPGVEIVGDDFGALFSFHATSMTLLFLAPAWIGLATYLVPLQVGAPRFALPRLQALSFWTYLAGGGTLVASYLLDYDAYLGITAREPFDALNGGGSTGADLWVAGLVLLALASLMASAGIVATVALMRPDGMTMLRLPAFTWASFLTAGATLLATPAFVAGLVLVYLDQHFGGEFFAEATRGTHSVYQHLVWLFGRPEVFLLTLPALGAACDIVATHARRPLLDPRVANGALAAFAVLSFGVWAQADSKREAWVLPTSTPLTALVVVPIVVLALLWLGTLAKSRPRLHLSLLFVVGAELCWLVGAANVVLIAFSEAEGSSWTTAHLHLTAFAPPTLLLVGAVHHWAPKLWGRALSSGLVSVALLSMLGGFLVMGGAGYWLGHEGIGAHLADVGGDDTVTNISRLAATGGVLVTLGALAFAAAVVAAAVRGARADAEADPYEGLTLEWSTASPPPPHNFDDLPEIRSEAPLADLRVGASAGGER